MVVRLLQLDDICNTNSADKIAFLFQKLGYNASAQQLAIDELDLPSRSAEAIWDAYMIADHRKGSESLQVLLFQLNSDEWQSPSTASNRMRSLAQSLCRRPSNFLLLGTKDYNQMMLVNPRKTFDADMNLKVSIRKLLIDRVNPTNYDRDRLEAIAARDLSPDKLYEAQCEAFDVEKLTKQFYQGYREIFEEVQRVIKANNPHLYFEDKSRLHQFSQRFLGRVMFLYFLQKKGFLGGDRSFLKNQYPKRSEPNDTDFYSELLEPVFFETLNKQRPNHESPWGKIPYLNGGLFDRDYGVDVKDVLGLETPPQIQLPNSLFDPSGEKSIIKFFNSYNFTVAENIQGDEEAAVDPEMLGKVFENLLAADERGQSGTFYTPRGIVHFMCVESLARYLADSTNMDVEDIKKLIEAEEGDLSDADFKKLLTKEQSKKLKQALESVKICDPAVGSGAYPLGMMQVMLVVRQAIARREGMTVQRGSLTISKWKRDIIANNLYGVDIKPEAVEIAKLRMWLSMIVDIPMIDDVEPLPNLDYKLMCGDSLISTIHGETLIPDPTKNEELMLSVTPIQLAIQPLIELKHQYFKSHANERKALREQIIESEKKVFQVAIADRRQYWETEQKELVKRIKYMKGKVSKADSEKQQIITTKLTELEKVESHVENKIRAVNFFQWHLHFHDVFKEKGGFDILIGNPPYIKIQNIDKKNADFLKKHFVSSTGKFDIYVNFVEQSFRLIHQTGTICLIHPHRFLTSDYGKGLKNFLDSNNGLELAICFGVDQVFETATTYTGIFQYSRDNAFIKFKYADSKNYSDGFYTHKKYSKDLSHWQFSSTSSTSNLINKLKSYENKLANLCKGIFQGIVTVGDDIFILPGKIENNYFEGFSKALNSQVRLEADMMKPLLKGEHIRRYAKPASELMIFYPHYQDSKKKTRSLSETVIKQQYPLSYEYIKQFKQHLIEKKIKYKTNPEHWFSLHRSRDINIFEGHKIITPQLQNYPHFTIDTEYWFTDAGGYCLVLKEETNISYQFLIGILNSSVLWFFIQNTSNSYNNNYYYFKTKYLESFSIPNSSQEQQIEISKLVQQIYVSKQNFCSESDIHKLENEIDQLVYQIYDLSAEEIAIIESSR